MDVSGGRVTGTKGQNPGLVLFERASVDSGTE